MHGIRSKLFRVMAPLARLKHRVTDIVFPTVDRFYRSVALRAHNFDEQWYLEQNPEVAGYPGPAWRHFLHEGLDTGLSARFFDPNWYFKQNPNLAGARIDGWSHYKQFGRREGRPARFLYINAEEQRSVRPEYRDWLAMYEDAETEETKNVVHPVHG